MGVAVPLREALTGEMSVITFRDCQHLFSPPPWTWFWAAICLPSPMAGAVYAGTGRSAVRRWEGSQLQ